MPPNSVAHTYGDFSLAPAVNPDRHGYGKFSLPSNIELNAAAAGHQKIQTLAADLTIKRLEAARDIALAEAAGWVVGPVSLLGFPGSLSVPLPPPAKAKADPLRHTLISVRLPSASWPCAEIV